MTQGRVNPNQTLETQGITGVAVAHYNYAESALVEAAVFRGEGRLGRGGAFLCSTGQFTGRSPKDKFVVRTAMTEDTIWWDNNAAMTPDARKVAPACLMASISAEIAVRRASVYRMAAAESPSTDPKLPCPSTSG